MRSNGFLSAEIFGGFFWNREPNTGNSFPVIKERDIARSPEACYRLGKQKECFLIVSFRLEHCGHRYYFGSGIPR